MRYCHDGLLRGFPPVAANSAEAGFIAYDSPQLFQTAHVAFTIEPQAHISTFGVFLLQMGIASRIEHLKISIRIEFGTIRHRTMNDQHGIYQPVGFCHDSTIDRAWRALTAGAMVFHGFPHNDNLFFGEPLPQSLVGHQYLSGMQMMRLAIDPQTKIMIRCYHIGHPLVCSMLTRQMQTLINHHLRMVAPMASVKRIILRYDLLFYVFR